jgi:hypothetical protein
MAHAYLVGTFEQPGAKTGMNVVSGRQNAIRNVAVNEVISVVFVRVRVLRGSAVDKQMTVPA